ncbi:hypothetical protein C8R46DRAFT_1210434 [Mycena filopes]|nr:hypothetical protein C8R46DRAFT_1210434 [Mycena filopes]
MSLVTFNCLAVLENPRVPDEAKQRSVVVDAQVFLNGSLPGLVACLRWYNEKGFEFPETIGTYSLWVQVASMTDAVEHFSDMQTRDYHFAGDILELIHLGPATQINPYHRTIVHLCGMVANPDEHDGTFEINAQQYITALKAPGAIRFKVLIPNNPRYTNKKKPVPAVNSRALVTGRVVDVQCVLDNDGKPRSVTHFVVEMDTVVFLGSTRGASGETPVMKPAFKNERGTPSQLKFSLSQPQLQTPSPAEGKKRKRDEPANDDKGEGSSKRQS